MFEPLLTQPEILTLDHHSRLIVTLHESTSDFSLLQAINGHIGEFIIVSVAKDALSVMVRLHPFLSVVVEPSSVELTSVFDGDTGTLDRGVGQGWRLFSALGTSPSMCARQLREGLFIDVAFDNRAQFSIAESRMWQIVALEQDNRLFHGPRELQQAKALVARAVQHDSTTEQLLLEISELEVVRGDLTAFSRSELVSRHPELSGEVTKLDAQLLRKKQWLSRSYNQSVERVSWQYSANQASKSEAQARKLEFYKLLSTPAVNEMVEQLIVDEE
ncbi:hypothetical protein [uncultured Shewanella sp.]|uniref:hypothetical protein n=1 Tax=Shewanella atlantica TaxID=271099 RepID=UPI0026183486|nr:hypothetical protein [uncultured Shewanella sp.]